MATVQLERTAFVAEGTAIADAERIQGTVVVSTIEAAQTYVARQEGVNRELAGTLRAVIPPTSQIVNQTGPVTPGIMLPRESLLPNAAVTPAPEGGTASSDPTAMSFTEIGTTMTVRDSDGCANGLQSQFSASTTSRIYLTTRALNIRSGTAMSVEWRFEGQVVHQEGGYTVPADDDDFCIWFYLEPSDVAFSTGNWVAQWFANGQPVEPAVSFTIN